MKDLRVNTGEIELQVREYEREGDAIIFLHYGGANLMMWQKVIPSFHNQYRLILPDLRGHGKSDKPDTGYHIDQMARDMAGVMQHLQVARAHVIGSSLGAEVGLSLAVNFPEKVISLACDGALYSEYGPYGVWEGSPQGFQERTSNYLNHVRNTPDPIYPSIDALIAESRRQSEESGWWDPEIEAAERYDACQVGEGQYSYAWHKRAKEDYMQYYFDYRFEEYYRQIKCPLLMLPGESEMQNERKKAAVKALSELAPQARIVAVPGWIHPYGWLVDPAAMTQVVLNFLQEQ